MNTNKSKLLIFAMFFVVAIFSMLAVSAADLEKIELSPSSANLFVGFTQELNATSFYDNGTIITSGITINYTTSNSSVATVNSSGVVTALAVGNTIITAQNGTNDTVVNTSIITVIESCPVVAVELGTAGNFVILAKTGISTTGTTTITGDIGVSPIDSTAITGFNLIADSTNTFSTSSLVTGKIYAADYTSPTPSTMTTSVSDMETAYTNANGLAACVTELGAGDISGLTLSSGVYKWGTGLLISTDVTLSGSSTDVWVFQIDKGLTVASDVQVKLSGGALAENVYWVVAESTILGTTSVFNGNILGKTNIAINTGAVLNGRALAQTAVTLDANSVMLSSSLLSSKVTTSDATILWVSEENANSTVNYGINSSLLGTIVSNSSLVKIHSISLTGLSSSTTYFYNTTSCVDDVCTTSGPFNFTTNTVAIIPVVPTTSHGGSHGGGYCVTEWTVSEWSTCINGAQTRVVSYRLDWCKPTVAKPTEIQICEVAPSSNIINLSNSVNNKIHGNIGNSTGSGIIRGTFFSNLWEGIKGFFRGIFLGEYFK